MPSEYNLEQMKAATGNAPGAAGLSNMPPMVNVQIDQHWTKPRAAAGGAPALLETTDEEMNAGVMDGGRRKSRKSKKTKKSKKSKSKKSKSKKSKSKKSRRN